MASPFALGPLMHGVPHSYNRSLMWCERLGRKALVSQTVRDSKQVVISERTLGNISSDPRLGFEFTRWRRAEDFLTLHPVHLLLTSSGIHWSL